MSANYKLVLRECKRRRTPDLDFSNQDITILPEDLFGLTQLRKLDLSGNHISSLDKRFEQLSGLESLDLRNNRLSEFPAVLMALPHLKKLAVAGNQFTDQWAFLNKVSDNFDAWRAQVKSILDKSARSFGEDFFSDEDVKSNPKLPSFVSKMSDSDEKRSHASKATASHDEKDAVAQMRLQIDRLLAEKAALEAKLMGSTRNGDGPWSSTGFKSQAFLSELQLRSPDEIKSREKISQGGFSIIEKGVFRGATVVVKRFFDPSNSPDTREEFLNEARVLNCVRHPNVVTMMGAYLPSNGSESFLVFEYVPGGNLYDAIHVKRLKFDKRAFLLKLAETMSYIHQSGICHRDLKSLNILLDSRAMPKVVDFGLARFAEGLNRGPMKFAATPSYSAPELFLQKELTNKVDVYAFGVIMWEVLVEDVPHRSMTPADIRKFVLAGQVLDVKSLASSASDIIRSCCAFDVDKRPSFEKVIEMLAKARF